MTLDPLYEGIFFHYDPYIRNHPRAAGFLTSPNDPMPFPYWYIWAQLKWWRNIGPDDKRGLSSLSSSLSSNYEQIHNGKEENRNKWWNWFSSLTLSTEVLDKQSIPELSNIGTSNSSWYFIPQPLRLNQMFLFLPFPLRSLASNPYLNWVI